MTAKRHLTDVPLDQFEEFASSFQQPAFAGRNLKRWIYERRATDFDQMTDLSAQFRAQLKEHTTLRQVRVADTRNDRCGTGAFLLQLEDGNKIETVVIPEEQRTTVCVSTQVGCPVACVFCASGMDGLLRNLTPGEIVEQVMAVQERLDDEHRVTNIVVMGIGEPTLNFEALVQALQTWNAPDGLGLGARRVTISTVGYPNRIHQLAELKKEFGLAISLHAANQKLREQILPGAGKVKLIELLAAARHYFQATHRRVTFEYVLLNGVNSTLDHAHEVAKLLRGFPCFVNLIPVNPVEGLPYQRPPASVTQAFREVLENAGLNVKQRKVRGDGIDAACGQLRLRDLAQSKSAAVSPPGKP